MSDELTTAVVLYIWGDQALAWPSRRPEALTARFGERAPDVLAAIEPILELLDSPPGNEPLEAATNRIGAQVRSAYPTLDGTAIKALTALYSYGWK